MTVECPRRPTSTLSWQRHVLANKSVEISPSGLARLVEHLGYLQRREVRQASSQTVLTGNLVLPMGTNDMDMIRDVLYSTGRQLLLTKKVAG